MMAQVAARNQRKRDKKKAGEALGWNLLGEVDRSDFSAQSKKSMGHSHRHKRSLNALPSESRASDSDVSEHSSCASSSEDEDTGLMPLIQHWMV
jgi:hypothetical protein